PHVEGPPYVLVALPGHDCGVVGPQVPGQELLGQGNPFQFLGGRAVEHGLAEQVHVGSSRSASGSRRRSAPGGAVAAGGPGSSGRDGPGRGPASAGGAGTVPGGGPVSWGGPGAVSGGRVTRAGFPAGWRRRGSSR